MSLKHLAEVEEPRCESCNWYPVAGVALAKSTPGKTWRVCDMCAGRDDTRLFAPYVLAMPYLGWPLRGDKIMYWIPSVSDYGGQCRIATGYVDLYVDGEREGHVIAVDGGWSAFTYPRGGVCVWLADAPTQPEAMCALTRYMWDYPAGPRK